MTATKQARSCPECRWEGSPGIHWTTPEDPLQQPYSVPCPARVAADAAAGEAERIQRVITYQHQQAFKAAKEILRDIAAARPVFSANDARPLMEAASIPSGVIGAAFSWAQREGLIEPTGARVMSTEATTRHRIAEYRSLTGRAGGVAS